MGNQKWGFTNIDHSNRIVKTEIKEEAQFENKDFSPKFGPGPGHKRHPARKYFYDPEKISETPDHLLPKHMRRHHKCEICGYETVNYNHAGTHKRLHLMGNECKNCKKPFKTQQELDRHMERYEEKGR